MGELEKKRGEETASRKCLAEALVRGEVTAEGKSSLVGDVEPVRGILGGPDDMTDWSLAEYMWQVKRDDSFGLGEVPSE